MRSWFFIAIILIFFVGCSKEEEEIFYSPLTELAETLESWQWVPIEGMKCRDNSDTGMGIRFHRSPKKLMIFLQGGGACFEPNTCETNPSNYNADNFEEFKEGFGQTALFNISRSENPFQDWNMVYLPYCTGDVHVGNKENGSALGVDEPQQFVGHQNFKRVVDLLAPYFNNQQVEEVAVVGLSAGAFGTLVNYIYAADAFSEAKVSLIDDSGPIMSDEEAFDPCMQGGLTLLYNIPLPQGFLGCCRPSYGLADIHTYLAERYPNGQFGLSSYYEDQTIRYFLGFGQNCFSGAEDLSAEVYRNALVNLRENVLKPTGKWSTFFVDGSSHVLMISDDRYFNTTVNGVKYTDWIGQVLEGKVLQLSD